jgi:general stress protein YciG
MKNKAAQQLGRKGGKARAKKLSPERRREIGRNAIRARWDKAKAAEAQQ